MNFDFLKYRFIFYALSLFLIVLSVFSLIFYRLKLGIDLTGGSVMELEFKKEKMGKEEIGKILTDLNITDFSLQPVGEKGLILKMPHLSEEKHQEILAKFGEKVEEKKFESIGPVIGKELKRKTWFFTFYVILAITVFIAFAFREVSRPVSSWQYGSLAALVAFFHDILIPIGIFSLLGKFAGVTVNIPIIVGILTILGYSVHDTIVVFDRIRENILRKRGQSFGEIINKSLNQTFFRSLNTSLTCLIVLFSLYFFGGETLKYFTLMLILGISIGTYSSIFIASPLLFDWQRWRKRT
jgi:preprotein translocase subunit SecF